MGEEEEKQIWQAASNELLDLKVRKQESCNWKIYQPAEYFISSKGEG